MVSIGRNDPCPCGSGKKYKKCCLKKESVVQLATVQKDQFHQLKHKLFRELQHFVQECITFEQFHQLKIEFKQRTKGLISKEEEEGFFTYWLYFFHLFPNGLRLIEWFYEEHEQRLSPEDKNRMRGWTKLQPRLLQAIEHSSANIYFQDMLTGEIFPVKRESENLPFFIPWMSTLGVVEPFQDTFYFHGIRPNGSPNDIKRAIKLVSDFASVQNESKEDVLINNYPEALAEFLKKDFHTAGEKEKEVVEYMVTYQVQNEDAVRAFLEELPEFQTKHWTEKSIELIWVGNHRIYEDNACDDGIEIKDVYGQIILENGKLQLKSLEHERVLQMKEMIQAIQADLVIEKEDKRVIGTTHEEAKNVMISTPEEAPEYFSLYAQSDLLSEIDKPQPMFDQLSIRELVNNDRKFDAEMWLRQSEYGMYRIVLDGYKKVDVTADFNTIRKALGMPLSPFVTGGTSRESNVKYIEQGESGHELLEQRIPALESLGFTPSSIDRFYTMDIIYFYEEKTKGLSEANIEKYRDNLSDLREILQQKPFSSWQDCGVSFWRTVVTSDYPKLHEQVSENAKEDFLNILKEFLMWVDETNETSHFHRALLFIEDLE